MSKAKRWDEVGKGGEGSGNRRAGPAAATRCSPRAVTSEHKRHRTGLDQPWKSFPIPPGGYLPIQSMLLQKSNELFHLISPRRHPFRHAQGSLRHPRFLATLPPARGHRALPAPTPASVSARVKPETVAGAVPDENVNEMCCTSRGHGRARRVTLRCRWHLGAQSGDWHPGMDEESWVESS